MTSNAKAYKEIRDYSITMLDWIPNAAAHVAESEQRDSLPIKAVEVLLQRAQISSGNPGLTNACWKLIEDHNKLLKVIHADVVKFMDAQDTGDIPVAKIKEIVYQHKEQIINNKSHGMD